MSEGAVVPPLPEGWGEGGEGEACPPPSYPEVVKQKGEEYTNTLYWQRGKGVLACNRHMLEQQLACDIWFRVGPDGARIGAHRYMLQSRSAAWLARLSGPGETDRDLGSLLDLPDTPPRVVWQLLRYLYYEEIHTDADSIFQLLALADRYEVTAVRDTCLQLLHDSVTVHTACEALEAAHRYGDEALARQCRHFIRHHVDEVLQTEGVGRLCRQCLDKVLTEDGAAVVSPDVRQEVTHRWSARRNSHRRHSQTAGSTSQPTTSTTTSTTTTTISTDAPTASARDDPATDDVLYVKRDHVQSQRFPISHSPASRLPSSTDQASSGPPQMHRRRGSAKHAGPSRVAGDPESSLSQPDSCHHTQSPCFARQSSFSPWADLNYVTRFDSVSSSNSSEVANNGTADAIVFSVDRNVHLYGFGIYGNERSGEEAAYKVDTIVSRKKRGVQLMETICIRGEGLVLPVILETPLRLEKGKLYTLEIYVQGPPSRRGAGGLAAASDGVVTFTFCKAAAVKGNRTTVDVGQIPRLYYLLY